MRLNEFVRPEMSKYLIYCNFSETERSIFLQRCRDVSIEQVAEKENLSVSGVKKIIKKINTKIEKVRELSGCQ